MTELTIDGREEWERREAFAREGYRQYSPFDPFSWSYAGKCAFASATAMMGSWSMYNIWYKKPWYAGVVPKAALLLVGVTSAYYMGKFRSYSLASRDAVVEHYMSLHEEDFERTSDRYGRPYRDILLPWSPIRASYYTPSKNDEESI